MNKENTTVFDVLVTQDQLERINAYRDKYEFESLSEMVNTFLIKELESRNELVPEKKQIAYLKSIVDATYDTSEAGQLMVRILKTVMRIEAYVTSVHGHNKKRMQWARKKAEKKYLKLILGYEVEAPWEFEDNEDPEIEFDFPEGEEQIND